MPLPDIIETLDRNLMRNRVYNSLLHWIVNGILQPGEKINDAEIAEKIGVSRTPVRESIRRLEDEGFIETSAHKWTRISQINLKQLEELPRIIAELEALALRMTIESKTVININKLKKINERMMDALERGDYFSAQESDFEFHKNLAAYAENNELNNLLANLKIKLKRMDLIFFKGEVAKIKSCEEHEQILDSLKRKDIENALQKLKKHWLAGFERIEKLKKKEKRTELKTQRS